MEAVKILSVLMMIRSVNDVAELRSLYTSSDPLDRLPRSAFRRLKESFPITPLLLYPIVSGYEILILTIGIIDWGYFCLIYSIYFIYLSIVQLILRKALYT